jgi:hypothetical protein
MSDDELAIPEEHEVPVGTITVERMGDEWQVRFNVGVQHFDIGPRYETLQEGRWMQNQFKIAQQRFIRIVTGIASVDKKPEPEPSANDVEMTTDEP